MSAAIGGAAGLAAALITVLVDRKRRHAEVLKLEAETENLREETEALRRTSLEATRAEYGVLLTEFLTPFENLLMQNERIYEALLEGRGALEYDPRILATFFSSLPYGDRRKLYWYQRIDRLRDNNHEILALIQQYGGRIVTIEFRDACAEFRYHADEWDDVWKAVESTHIALGNEEEPLEGDPIPGGKIVGHGQSLYANRFPPILRPALTTEIDNVRARVGSGSMETPTATGG